VTELPEGAVLRDSEIKGISSGELMTAEHKNKDPFDFSPFATLWMATNHMPHCRDHSNAIYRRAEVLSFNREFKGDKADTDLSNKLIKELPGIFKMATDAIAGVFITGQFTHCPSSEKAKSSWRLESDQVMQFLADEYEEASGEMVLLKDIFHTYRYSWAPQSGAKHTYGRNKFYQRLKELGCTVKDTNQGDALVGYRIKPTQT
jgi:putative DNA primase/helicase